MPIHSHALEIVQTLVRHGYLAYFAGGWVRDFVMGRISDDIDIATDAPIDVILDLFPRTLLVGIQFGVVIVLVDGHQYTWPYRQRADHCTRQNRHARERCDPANARLDPGEWTIDAGPWRKPPSGNMPTIRRRQRRSRITRTVAGSGRPRSRRERIHRPIKPAKKRMTKNLGDADEVDPPGDMQHQQRLHRTATDDSPR